MANPPELAQLTLHALLPARARECVVSDVFNAFRAPSGASYLEVLPSLVRALVSPLGAVVVLGLAAACGNWRTRRWEGGFVAALGVSVVVWFLMAAWWSATVYPFAQVQQSNPYWVDAWHWSTHRGTPDETFLDWVVWDNVGAQLVLGLAMLGASCVYGGIGGALGVITSRWRSSGGEA